MHERATAASLYSPHVSGLQGSLGTLNGSINTTSNDSEASEDEGVYVFVEELGRGRGRCVQAYQLARPRCKNEKGKVVSVLN
jgi:hypothetical protein